jgi:hypothetical protein
MDFDDSGGLPRKSRIVCRRNLDFRGHLHSAGEDTGRSQENETFRRKIYVSSGAANCSPIISPRRPLPPPHHRLTDSFFEGSGYPAANFICWRQMRFAGRKRDSTPGSGNSSRTCGFFGRGRGRIAGNLEPRADFRCCSAPVKSSAENRAVRRLYRRLGRSFGTFAEDSKLPPQFQKFRWKSAGVAEVSRCHAKFSIFSGETESSAEEPKVRRKFRFSGGMFCLPVTIWIFSGRIRFFSGSFFSAAELLLFRRNFWFFSGTLRPSAEDSNLQRKFWFSSGTFGSPATDLDFPPNSEISSGGFNFSAEVSIFRRNVRRSADDLDFPAEDSNFRRNF